MFINEYEAEKFLERDNNNKNNVIAVIKQYPELFKKASDKLKHDKDFMMELLDINASVASEFIQHPYFSNEIHMDLILKAVRKKDLNINLISRNVWEEPEFLEKIFDANIWTHLFITSPHFSLKPERISIDTVNYLAFNINHLSRFQNEPMTYLSYLLHEDNANAINLLEKEFKQWNPNLSKTLPIFEAIFKTYETRELNQFKKNKNDSDEYRDDELERMLEFMLSNINDETLKHFEYYFVDLDEKKSFKKVLDKEISKRVIQKVEFNSKNDVKSRKIKLNKLI
jgi:hypothetical protein